MEKPNNTEVKVIAVVALLLLGGHLLDTKDKEEALLVKEQVKNYFPPPPEGVRNLDYNTGKWVLQEKHNNKLNLSEPLSTSTREIVIHQDQFDDNLSDEEIRILREKQSYKPGGSYIYTPGRNVKSREKITDEAIEKYLDKHGEELYDELRDKYEN